MASIKPVLLNVLKWLKLYHPLQSRYRSFLRARLQRKLLRDYAAYEGEGFICNCCGAVYSTFASNYPEPENKEALDQYQVIAGYGEQVWCPRCLSNNRERLIVAVLNKLQPKGQRVLVLSPERPVLRFLQQQNQVVTADLEPGFYRTIDPHILPADATALPFADESFNLVIGNHIMEHIPQDKKAMQEIFRVLKAQGQAILQVPFSTVITFTLEDIRINDPARQSALFGQKDHVRIYCLQDYLERLRSVGFEVIYHPYETLAAYYQFAIQPQEGFIEIIKPASGKAPEQA